MLKDLKNKPQMKTGIQSKPSIGELRGLTKHVVTRWYRAPELILVQDHYN